MRLPAVIEGHIGIFDSGIGGLSVWREIVHQLPYESTLYFADQAHIPYGPRPLKEVRRYAVGITRFLLAQGAKIIVVACNTASGAALYHLRETFPQTRFVGMEPAVKPAAERSRCGTIGVIATPATLQGELFRRLSERFTQQVTLKTQVCPGLVECVEAGNLTGPDVEALLHHYLDPMVEAGIDQLVLGCTHYPFLSATIQQVIGPNVTLIDPAPAVARQVKRVLTDNQLLAMPCERKTKQAAREGDPRKTAVRFYTTGDTEKLAVHLHRLVPTEDVQAPIFPVTWKNSRIVRVRP
jgi:glutamate racemase